MFYHFVLVSTGADFRPLFQRARTFVRYSNGRGLSSAIPTGADFRPLFQMHD
jgi:hypothetical protein